MKTLSALVYFFLFSCAINTYTLARDCNEKKTQDCKVNPLKDFNEYGLNNYTQWPWITGYQISGLHWNQFVTVFINGSADIYKNNYAGYLEQFLEEDDEDEDEDEESVLKFGSYPAGTVVAKENYSSSDGKPGDLVSITVMVKQEAGFDTKRGDWEYLWFSPQGKVLMRGNSSNPAIEAACSSCHGNVADRDYLFSTSFSVP